MESINDLQSKRDRLDTLEAADKAFWANVPPLFLLILCAFSVGAIFGMMFTANYVDKKIFTDQSGKTAMERSVEVTSKP